MNITKINLNFLVCLFRHINCLFKITNKLIEFLLLFLKKYIKIPHKISFLNILNILNHLLKNFHIAHQLFSNHGLINNFLENLSSIDNFAEINTMNYFAINIIDHSHHSNYIFI